MHDVTTSHWHEPEGTKNAGYGAWHTLRRLLENLKRRR